MEMFADAAFDSVKMLPFLFVAFLIMEALERYSSELSERALRKIKSAGPVVGAVFGCIPQCGFSVMAANLYSGGVITLGTLLAVFMATSDEAILILIGHREQGGVILSLLAAKVVISVIVGYVADLFWGKKVSTPKDVHKICEEQECGCEEESGILKPALRHTVKIFIYVFLFNLCLNVVLEAVGVEQVAQMLLKDSYIQPFLTALLGLIPNCAASVLITELYIQGMISFASAVAGLCAGAGIGLAVLFRVNRNTKENLTILGMLYGLSVAVGLCLNILRFCF